MTLYDFITNHFFRIVGETLYMVGIAAIISIILGSVLAAILFINFKSNKTSSSYIYKVLNFIVNGFRSFPFIVLVLALIPFTRHVMRLITGVGISTGNTAAIVPLTIAATPFFAKVIENALIEVDNDVIEAAYSLGLSNMQVLLKVIFKEALPSIVNGISLSVITLIGFSAIVVNIGAGGIGGFAMAYGVVMFDNNAMLFAVITLILLVALIQGISNVIYKKLK